MKRLRRFLAVLLCTLVAVSGTSLAASAASCNPVEALKCGSVASCIAAQSKLCGSLSMSDIQKAANQCGKGNCDLQSVIEQFKNGCCVAQKNQTEQVISEGVKDRVSGEASKCNDKTCCDTREAQSKCVGDNCDEKNTADNCADNDCVSTDNPLSCVNGYCDAQGDSAVCDNGSCGVNNDSSCNSGNCGTQSDSDVCESGDCGAQNNTFICNDNSCNLQSIFSQYSGSTQKNIVVPSGNYSIQDILARFGFDGLINQSGSGKNNSSKPTQPEQPKPEQPQQNQPAQQEQSAKPTKPATDGSNNSYVGESGNGYSVSEYEQQVVEIVNRYRAQYGLNPVKLNTELSRVARIKSQDMKDRHYFNHTSPTYGSPFDMMKKFGISYRAAGENIAMGQRTPEQVMTAWMNSDGHRANILNASYTEIGVGYVADGNYWTQMFIAR